jgi:hypothetical protein
MTFMPRETEILHATLTLIHKHLICWADTPLWYRNPWSAENSGRCALQRTMNLNCIQCSVTSQTPSIFEQYGFLRRIKDFDAAAI